MTRTSTTLIRLAVAACFGGGALLWSGHLPVDSQSTFVASAEARIGRPLTPMSYAGVARRTTRRAVAVGVGAAAVGTAVMVAPSCGQAVDAYGRIVTVCQ